ncbi:hypothetical protein GOP47_0023791 [Adiantum capillus-veneris]|uniref:Cilia- and flagella-associated protein 251 n=1 Tax=Adiantum capillus-veneris TaxID=13818 RepID=A0A9D4Z695_ADICA|nr:hypothetical protein GOP47_0023791 [Adiantum capillus-veneris]
MDSPLPLELQWVFGISSDVRGGVVDLRTGTNKSTIAYAAGHTLVTYNRSQHRQSFLQGHIHRINCLSACPKKKYIVSADCGPDAILIIWNCETEQVHSSIPQKETGGVVAIDFLKKGDGFATLSNTGRNRMQTFCIWNIEATSCKLVASLSAFFTDAQHCLQINKDNQDEFVTNGKATVYFWSLLKEERANNSVSEVLGRQQAMIKTAEMEKSIHELTLSSFLPSIDAAITGMTSGEVIFWQEPRSPFYKERSKPFSPVTDKEECKKEPSARRMYAIKIVRLHHSPITHLSVQDSYLVTGGSDGYIRFYDCRLGLVGWFEELQAGEITSLSFSAMEQETTGVTLLVPPFVVGTKKGHVVLLDAAIFEEPPGSLHHKGESLLDFVPKTIKCVSAHPQLPHFGIINADGLLQVHDYNTRRLCSQREFSKIPAETIAYSPTGLVFACGFFNGFLKIIDANLLQDIENIAISRSGITKLEFASDESLLAVADASFAVSLVSCFVSEGHLEDKWEYVGKFRSHARTIIGLHFTKEDDGNNRLFSVGHDSMIVEYDLIESVKEKRLKLTGTWPLNGMGLPEALHSTTAFEKGEEHLAFGTKNRILGVMVLPLKSNKNVQFMGVVGHAGSIQHMALSHDCKILITVAAEDGIINLWRVSLPLTEKFFEYEPRPFLGHFKGGIGAKSLQLIKEYFFTSQIFSQGESFANERVLDDTVDIDQLHNLLCALGVFPSFHELQEILTEIKETIPMQKSISFNDFLPIFLNHKPTMDLDASTFQHAFSALGADSGSGRLNMDLFLTMLQGEGEKMTRYLAAKSDTDHYNREEKREMEEIVCVPEKEAEEVAEILAKFGLQPSEYKPVVEALRKRPADWLEFMMRFELGLEKPDPTRAVKSAATIAMSYVVGGIFPLTPYMAISHVQQALHEPLQKCPTDCHCGSPCLGCRIWPCTCHSS